MTLMTCGWTIRPAGCHVGVSMVGHRQEFDRELETVEAKVIELFAMVAEDLPAATKSLLSGDNDVLQVLAEREQVTDILHSQIEELVKRDILLQAPVASDLRFLLAVLQIVPDLDRSYHLVVDIAVGASHILTADLSLRSRGLIEQMGTLASDMWRRAADAWYQRDRTASAWLRQRDDEMRELRTNLATELCSGQVILPVAMEMALVGRFYERLGDHTVNIGRSIIYLAGSAGSQLLP